MKTPRDIETLIDKRLARSWHTAIAGEGSEFPHSFPLGKPTSEQMSKHYSTVLDWTGTWKDWAARHSAELTYENRRGGGGSLQIVPTHVTVSSLDHAARIIGNGWLGKLERARVRMEILRRLSVEGYVAPGVLRTVSDYSGVDFALLYETTEWVKANPGGCSGLTPRQVPIPGVHAKWLQSHMAPLLQLTGLETLGLRPPHPSRIHFTYLDDFSKTLGSRKHDSATVGDSFEPLYTPRIVIISENKDTAMYFPDIPKAISVEGAGRGGKTLASFPWIKNAPYVIYWGDIDADGYEILSGYREDFDRDLDSIFMDMSAYKEFSLFGTNTSKAGATLGGRRCLAPRLREEEREVYELLCLEEHHVGPRRIEQERIPLARAKAEVTRICGL